MYSHRTILALLVLANIVTHATTSLISSISSGFILPIQQYILGKMPDLTVGPFNIGTLLAGFAISIVTIIVGALVLVVLLKLCWRFIAMAMPNDS